MHPVYHSDRLEDLCHPIDYEDPPNPEPVDIILTPLPTDSPNSQPSPDESKPLQTTTLLKEPKRFNQNPPVTPPRDPYRSAKKETWLLKFCKKIFQKLKTRRTGQDREKPRHIKKRDRFSRRRGGADEYADPGLTRPFFMDPIFGGVAFGGAAYGLAAYGLAAFTGAGAGAACAASAASDGGACGC